MSLSIGEITATLALKDSLSPALKVAGHNLQQAGQTLQGFGTTAKGLATNLLPMSAAIAGLGGFAIKSAIDFESSFAGIRKTVDATEPEFAALAAGFRKLSTEIPVSVNELNRIGEAAGQLGIRTENILSFSRVMADLGVATNLSSDQAATALARLANITQMPQDQFDRLGSTIVALGNNLATTEAEITEFGLRIAGAGKQIGLSEAQILSIGAALSSVGISAEAGGTSISKVMIDMAASVDQGGERLWMFANVAGVSAAAFKEQFQTNAVGALTAFVTGLGSMESRGQSTLSVLADMGLEEVRLRDALLRASGAGDLLSRSIAIGTDAWAANIALTKEAAQRYRTTSSQLTTLWNNVNDVAITLGEALLPVLTVAINKLREWIPAIQAAVELFQKLPPAIQNIVVILGGLVAVAAPALLVLGSLTTGLGAVLSVVGMLSKALGFLSAASLPALITPLGLALIAAAGLALAVLHFRQQLKGLQTDQDSTGQAIQGATDALGNQKLTIEQAKAALADLDKASGKATISGLGLGKELRIVADSTATAGIATNNLATWTRKLTDEEKKAAEAIRELRAEVKALEGAGQSISFVFQSMDDSLTKLGRAFDETKLGEMVDRLREAENYARIAAFGFSGMVDELTNLGDKAIPVTTDQLGRMERAAQDVGPQFDYLANRARTLGEDLRASFHDLPSLFVKAFTGGGGISGALNAFGATLGGKLFGTGGAFASVVTKATGSLTKVFGETIGGALGAAIPGIGALIGPGLQLLWGGIKKLFGGPSKEELAGRDLVSAFEKQVAGMLTEGQKLEAGNERWKQTVIVVRDAYLALGKTEQEALAAVETVWRSSKEGAEATKAAIGPVQEALAAMAAKNTEAARHIAETNAAMIADVSTKLTGLVKEQDDLVKRISAEAPEEVMGVLEQIDRAKLESVKAAIAGFEQEKAKILELQIAGEAMGQGIAIALQGLAVEATKAFDAIPDDITVRLHGQWDIPDLPRFSADVESFQSGGPVRRTGLKLLHEGEFVVPRGGTKMSNSERANNDVVREISGLRRDLIALLPTLIEKAARHGAQTAAKR